MFIASKKTNHNKLFQSCILTHNNAIDSFQTNWRINELTTQLELQRDELLALRERINERPDTLEMVKKDLKQTKEIIQQIWIQLSSTAEEKIKHLNVEIKELISEIDYRLEDNVAGLSRQS